MQIVEKQSENSIIWSMASSSSSSQLNSTSISQSWNYDVFLSFRGEDTRKNIVDHLYTALVAKDIRTYKDDETLDRGEVIGHALLKAIRESRIAVIVFSNNYADSSWCLDELAYIIECKETRGQIVMPVFYDVDPSIVRRQNGKYGEAFTKHESEHGEHKVKSWRKALEKSGNLSGWVPKDFANGHEAKLIKEIVDTVNKKLSPVITFVDEDLIGIETRLQDLESKLEIGSGGVRMVGIWGVGGGGKTTLASAAYTEFSHQFEAYCLLLNIRDESNKNGLKSLQENILSSILKETVVLGNEVDGKNMIKKRLSNKSVLVVLDDVDDLKQLKALAGSHDWFGEGSRIIITTRDEHLLNYCKADVIYVVSLLSNGESLELFNRHAYRKDEPVKDYEMLSLKVVSYSNGLPLALEVLGSYLCDKNKEEWLISLAKLNNILHAEITERLKISYDGLQPHEQELFLDIACFWRRREKDKAMEVLDTCCFHAVIGLKVLVQKCLIKISEYGYLDMHDLVEEMAVYIVRGEHRNSHPEKHSRIWKKKDIAKLCDTRTVAFKENNHTEVIRITQYHDVDHPRLPDIVTNMKKLRWIDWYGYPAASFPASFYPTNLGRLTLKSSKQKQLWQGCKHLPILKYIDLSESDRLKSTPDFTGLPRLETLILKSCKSLEEIHPSIGYHERLVFVNMSYCSKLKTFPPIIRMKKLEKLDLSYSKRLKKFPDIQSNMDSLVNLNFYCTDIDIIPPSAGQFCTNVVHFELRGCDRLKRIEGNFRLLKHLKKFHVSSYKLQRLPWDFFDKECCLEVLSITGYNHPGLFTEHMGIIGIPYFQKRISVSLKLIPQFPRFLKTLDLSFCCLGDGDIPSDISGLLNLQKLYLSRNNFTRLPFSLARLSCLKLLSMSYCHYLVELPDLPSSIAILDARYCDALERVGDLSNYKCLWKISFSKCNKLIGGESQLILHSILERNAVADRLMSVILPLEMDSSSLVKVGRCKKNITLQLPQNWYNDFGGFLFCVDTRDPACVIVFEPKTYVNSQPVQQDQDDEFNQQLLADSNNGYAKKVGYVPFSSLRHTKWWNSAFTVPNCNQEKNAGYITFQIDALTGSDPKVELVPRKSKTWDSSETTIDPSEIWEEEEIIQKTFEIREYGDDSFSVRIGCWHFCN